MKAANIEWDLNIDQSKMDVFDMTMLIDTKLKQLLLDIYNFDVDKTSLPECIKNKIYDELTSYRRSIKVIDDVHTKNIISILETLPERPYLLENTL